MYKLIGVNGKEITQHDLQDKGVWCRTGEDQEETFVGLYGKELKLIINPEKKINKYAPDLFNIEKGVLADLKTQNTPFFQSRARFGYDPQYAIVFNGKDRTRYKELYPELEIYFCVDWQVLEYSIETTTIKVEPMVGVWKIPFSKLDQICKKAPFHNYQQRKFDNKGNAKGSYVLSLSSPKFERVI